MTMPARHFRANTWVRVMVLPTALTMALTMALATAPIFVPQASAQILAHPNDLPPLTPDAHFPRCTYRELEDIGFPDHMHYWHWPGWGPGSSEQEIEYGPGFLRLKKKIVHREGLVLGEGVQRYGNFAVHHNPGYEPSYIIYYLELLDWAGRTLPEMLGLAVQDTLHVISPDTIEMYREQTGFDVWRLYSLEGDRCISEPLPVLQARTLDGHAIFALVTEWLLTKSIPNDIPPWLLRGLAEYMSESGVHLVNYMVQYRDAGPILLSPSSIDSILSSGPNPDLEKDRELYRKASYSAFLMAWELVENQGGLDALRDFLDHLAGGMSVDEAGTLVYGVDLQGLSEMLDPVGLGEPIGKATQGRRPHEVPE